MYRDVYVLEKLGNSFQLHAHHRSADVVGMVMGCQHPSTAHVVGGKHCEQAFNVVSRVNQHRFTALTITDRIDEVDHLRCDGIVGSEVSTR